MKPLAHWAIHRQQKLRLQGRSEDEIWGLMAGPDGTVQPFRYDRHALRLSIGEGETRRLLQLDEYGFERELAEVEAEVEAEAEVENETTAYLDEAADPDSASS